MSLNLPKLNGPIRTVETLAVGANVRLGRTGTEQLHFRKIREKEAFTILDNAGKYFRAKVTMLSDRDAEGHVYEEMAHSPESPLELTLVCAVLARQRMIFVAQKAAELGVHRIFPALTEFSVQPDGLEHEKAHAWPGNAIRGARQCRRAIIPDVREPAPLATFFEDEAWKAADVRYYLDDRAEGGAPLEGEPSSLVVAIGPEGGWSDAEREALQDAGALPLIFGGRVLRAETAVLAGLTLVQHHFGDLN